MPRKTLYEQRFNAAHKAGWRTYEERGGLLDALRFADKPLLRNHNLTARSVFIGAFRDAWDHHVFNGEMPTDFDFGYLAGFFSPDEYASPLASLLDQSSPEFVRARKLGEMDRKRQEASHV